MFVRTASTADTAVVVVVVLAVVVVSAAVDTDDVDSSDWLLLTVDDGGGCGCTGHNDIATVDLVTSLSIICNRQSNNE